MEYMSIKGSVELKSHVVMDRLKNDVLDVLENIMFLNDDGIVTSKIKNDRLWILGEGLLKETEANKLIAIVRRIYGYSERSCCIDVQRIRWELNIILGNENTPPEPSENALALQEAS